MTNRTTTEPTNSGQRVTLVLFDCDGTLVDSQHVIVDAMQAAFDAHGLPKPSPEAVRRVVGLSLHRSMAVLAPDISAADHDLLTERYKQAFIDQRAAGRPQGLLYPGAADAIERLLGQGHVLGVATGKSQRGLAATLERFALRDYFTTLQTADDAPSKPHPGMVHRAIDETGATPASTVVIGDTTFDVEMAVSAGAAAIGVSWGYHEVSDLHRAGARCVLDQFHEVDQAVAAAFEAEAWA